MFDRWWRDARSTYLRFNSDRPAQSVTFYYDPTLDYHHMAPVSVGGLLPAFYLAPQHRADARAMYQAGIEQLELDASMQPVRLLGPRMTGLTIALSREFGEQGLADALLGEASQQYEPRWDRERGEFSWGFGLGEPHPRGQYNAAMAAGEAMSEGAWTRLFNDPHPERFNEPTVIGVDFPTLALRQAWWDAERGRLFVATSPQNEAVCGRPTSIAVANLEGDGWRVEVDGESIPTRRNTAGEWMVDMTVGSHRIAIYRD